MCPPQVSKGSTARRTLTTATTTCARTAPLVTTALIRTRARAQPAARLPFGVQRVRHPEEARDGVRERVAALDHDLEASRQASARHMTEASAATAAAAAAAAAFPPGKIKLRKSLVTH